MSELEIKIQEWLEKVTIYSLLKEKYQLPKELDDYIQSLLNNLQPKRNNE